jgi:hypothetical protein
VIDWQAPNGQLQQQRTRECRGRPSQHLFELFPAIGPGIWVPAIRSRSCQIIWRKVLILVGLIFALRGVAIHVEAQSGAGWSEPAWAYRSAVTITNPGGAILPGYRVTLDRLFGFAKEERDGYYRLGSPQTVLVKNQPWETAAPHTLSVVQANRGGYTYWGYYGLKDGCGGVGLAQSNDLVNWTKHSVNPLFSNGRWPSVLKVGNTFYMLYEKGFCATSYIKLATSTDGITFNDLKTIVEPQSGVRNQNPNLFYSPNDGKYYIYWYRGDDTATWDIKARSAANIKDLDNTASEIVVIHSTSVVAAPNMLYYNNTYFLSTEVVDSSNKWNVRIYASKSSPTSGFFILPGNPVLANGSACLFQHVFGTTLHEYYCKHTDSTWTIEHRAADLAAGRLQFQVLDPGMRTIVTLLAISLLLAFLIFLALRGPRGTQEVRGDDPL